MLHKTLRDTPPLVCVQIRNARITVMLTGYLLQIIGWGDHYVLSLAYF